MSKMKAQQLLLLMTVVIGVFFVVSCSNHVEPNIVKKEYSQFTESAIDYFEKHQHIYTRSNSQTPTEKAPYILGEFAPDWNTETSIANDAKIYSDFELTKESRFVLFPGYDVDVASVELHSQFVSIIDYKNDTINQYVATYIPSPEYISTYVEELENGLFNCEHLSDFSGVILHTTPTGYHISATRYANGIRTAHAFLYNKEQKPEENISDFLNIMDGISVGIITRNISKTRSDDIIDGGEIEIIEIVYHKLEFTQIVLLEDIYGGGNDNIADTLIGDSGGGGGSGSTNTTTEELIAKDVREQLFDTSSLSKDEEGELEEMLQEILGDCMGEELCRQLLKSGERIEFIFNDTRSSNICYSNDGIEYISMRNNRSEGLIHEMFHAYQIINGDYDDFQNNKPAYEIEAYIATCLYIEHNILSDVEKRLKSIEALSFGPYITFLCNYDLYSDGSVVHGHNHSFEALFAQACAKYAEFQNIKNYQHKQHKWTSLTNLLNISKNC